MSSMRRYWINQPSRLQQDHRFHGWRVLGPADLDTTVVRVYPTESDVTSMDILASSLSEGWPKSKGERRQLVNPWYDRRNELSPQYFEVREPIDREEDIDFYQYESSVLGVLNHQRAGYAKHLDDQVLTQCVTVAGAIRHLFGQDYVRDAKP